jgi:glycine cleavage system H protein
MALKPTPDRSGQEVRYTKDHEWVRRDDDIVTIGVTEYAQEQLGDLVFVELPEVGREFEAADAVAVVESVKAAADVFAPVAGKITEVNQSVVDDPSLVNSEPEADGWLFKMEMTDPDTYDNLLDEAGYREFLESL